MTSSELHQPGTGHDRPPAARRPLVLSCALVLVLSLAAAVPVLATSGGGGEAARLRSDLDRIAELVNGRLRPPALRLARDLPGDGKRINRLREPASTARAQLKVALDELQRMSALKIDSHYLPALIAVGRAYTAVSGDDPVTGTKVNAEYLGLESELATSEARLTEASKDASGLYAAVNRLREELVRSKRRANRIERQIRGMRARNGQIEQR